MTAICDRSSGVEVKEFEDKVWNTANYIMDETKRIDAICDYFSMNPECGHGVDLVWNNIIRVHVHKNITITREGSNKGTELFVCEFDKIEYAIGFLCDLLEKEMPKSVE